MSMIELGLENLLKTTLASLVGTRVYAVAAPIGAVTPFCTYHLISSVPSYTLNSAALQKSRYQIDAWSSKYSDVKAIAAAIDSALSLFSGPLSDGTDVLSCVKTMQFDSYEHDTREYRTTSEYSIQFI